MLTSQFRKTKYISQKKTKPSKRFLTSWAYLPFKKCMNSFSGSTNRGPNEEKRKMHKQDTRVHARADSALATWASDESQDLVETEWLWKWETLSIFGYWLHCVIEYLMIFEWHCQLCVLHVSSANSSRSILIGL